MVEAYCVYTLPTSAKQIATTESRSAWRLVYSIAGIHASWLRYYGGLGFNPVLPTGIIWKMATFLGKQSVMHISCPRSFTLTLRPSPKTKHGRSEKDIRYTSFPRVFAKRLSVHITADTRTIYKNEKEKRKRKKIERLRGWFHTTLRYKYVCTPWGGVMASVIFMYPL